MDILPGADGSTLRGYQLLGRARDDRSGEATVRADLDGVAKLLAIDTLPSAAGVDRLVGLTVRQGFRDAVRDAVPDEVRGNTPLALLLDDLPVAALISGYGLLYTGQIPAVIPENRMQAGICSGWRPEGTMMVSVRLGRGVPTPLGPSAPDPDPAFAWLEPLPRLGMRRQRLVDTGPVDAAGDTHVYAWFRDTFVDADGSTTVLHEYDLTARLRDGRFTSVDAVPRVLPWVECPVAAASSDTLVGLRPPEVRDHVKANVQGERSCTHLNDLLRSLGDVTA